MPNNRPILKYKRRRRGFSLLTMALFLPMLVAAAGLAVDLGRIYVAKSELQNFVDTAAISAAFELDGTQTGLSEASSAATSGPGTGGNRNRWLFNTAAVPTPEVAFATSPNGTFSANPGNAAGYRFVRVSISGPVPVYFLRVVPGIPVTQNVTAVAVAGQGLDNSIGPGAAPFSPDAQDPSDPNFGYTIGQRYTLKWAPPGQRNKTGGRCPGDLTFNPGGGSSDRGYIDVGQGNGNSGLYDAIVNNSFYSTPITIGSTIDHVNGNKHVGPAMDERYNQDTDLTSTNDITYSGNGRRLMITPINNGQEPAIVVGFGRFLLEANSCTTNQKPCCAIYLGNNPVIGSVKPGAGGPGLYRVKLFY
jgi:Flp pilus assembly protein TadG